MLFNGDALAYSSYNAPAYKVVGKVVSRARRSHQCRWAASTIRVNYRDANAGKIDLYTHYALFLTGAPCVDKSTCLALRAWHPKQRTQDTGQGADKDREQFMLGPGCGKIAAHQMPPALTSHMPESRKVAAPEGATTNQGSSR